MTRAAVLMLALLAPVIAGCGDSRTVREPDLDAGERRVTPDRTRAPRDGEVRIAVVTHGEASSRFWAIVRNGVETAAREVDVQVDYRAPEGYSIERMTELIEAAVATRPDGLVVSLPEPAIGEVVRRAVGAGIPTVTINSGSDIALDLGVLAHVGQPERRSGLEAGRRLVEAGVRDALCVNQQPGNVGLDARCRGLARAMEAAGGRARVLGIDDQDPETVGRIERAVRNEGIDGVLALNSGGAIHARDAMRKISRDVPVATFDLGPDVLQAVQAGEILFAVDQQAFLQGYLPVTFLAQRARFGLFPEQGEVIATGPNFVTRANAAQAIELSRRSIR